MPALGAGRATSPPVRPGLRRSPTLSRPRAPSARRAPSPPTAAWCVHAAPLPCHARHPAPHTLRWQSWSKPLLHRAGATNILGPIFRNSSVRNPDGSRPNISVIDSVFIDPTAEPSTCERAPPVIPVMPAGRQETESVARAGRRYRGVSGAMPFSSCDGVSWWLDEHQFALPRVPGWGIQSFDTQSATNLRTLHCRTEHSMLDDRCCWQGRGVLGRTGRLLQLLHAVHRGPNRAGSQDRQATIRRRQILQASPMDSASRLRESFGSDSSISVGIAGQCGGPSLTASTRTVRG